MAEERTPDVVWGNSWLAGLVRWWEAIGQEAGERLLWKSSLLWRRRTRLVRT